MKTATIMLSSTLAALLAGCAMSGGMASSDAARATPAPVASTELAAADGSPRGEARVTEASDGLHVLVKAKGLTPGMHAVHIHTTGNCTPPDFKSAGGHWNPTGHQHGRDNPAGMHMGDMPNMMMGADGMGQLEYVVPGGTLHSGAMPLLDTDGAAIVIHAQADDNKTDPAGNAGDRVACGVLTGA